ncbi:hypothetical protein J0818_29590 [Bacillus cereus]|uniref:Uncharacterized protein n=1 Tax=Bacillus mobilis TaxID=2026190 RepID=A0A1Y5Z0H4_9BACI|nr:MULTISPECIES: hypothetical protein [Bacillus cereus group]MBL3741303.1 hypothetical protein [Bacillus cereus]MBL3864137.1 hypothetical protein [Bacillus cereus]SMD76093.1 hypothetical protein BACERE00185_00857 [Bacillus mobilis]
MGYYYEGFEKRDYDYNRHCRTGYERVNVGNPSIVHFLRRLSPGTCIALQYDCQPPTTGTFQGFEYGTVILSNFDCFPGLAHVAVNKINAVSISSPECHRRMEHREKEY